MSFLKIPNLYAYAALVVLGGMIVSGIYLAGAKAERNKTAAETAAVNAPIIEQRGKDEAEIAAEASAAKATDAAVAGAITQSCPATEATAKALALLK